MKAKTKTTKAPVAKQGTDEKDQEMIMCIPTTTFKNICKDCGLDRAASLLYNTPGATMLIPRGVAEKANDLVQLVSYVVIRSSEGVLVYRRGKSGGEDRLHDQWSVGVGGHVNGHDVIASLADSSLRTPGEDEVDVEMSPVIASVRRELNEELDMDNVKHASLSFICNLYDDSQAVSRQHVGFAFLLDVGAYGDKIRPAERCLEDVKWVSMEDLQTPVWASLLETWSVTVVSRVAELELSNTKASGDSE